jgi:LysM repeat protein
MNNSDSPQSVIKKFEKRQKLMPFILGVLAGILALVGIFIIITVVSGSKKPLAGLFATKTPTATATFTPTATVPTPTASNTPEPTQTFTPSPTATASGPQIYEVQENDDCYTLADRFGVDFTVLLTINNFPNGTCPIIPGQKIIIPAPGQTLPTPTPIPSDLPRGTVIDYTVQIGDTLESIASLFDSTVEDIIAKNKITDINMIYPGQVLKIRVHLVTPTPTRQATSTLAVPATATPTPTKTP